MAAYNPINIPQDSTDFDVVASNLARRRKMAELLQEKALGSIAAPLHAGRTSVFEPLGKVAQALASVYMNKQAGEGETANAAARQESYDKLLAGMPQGQAATPGTPEMGPPTVSEQLGTDARGMPSTDPAQGYVPQGGMQPAAPGSAMVPPDPQKLIQWAGQIGRTGPEGASIAKAVTEHALGNMLPKAISPEVAANLASQAEDRRVRAEETRVQNMGVLAQKEAQLRADIEKGNLDRESRERMSKDHNAVLRAIHEASGAKAGQMAPYSGVGKDGQRLVIAKDGSLHAALPDGSIDSKPYGGAVTPQTVQEKNVAAIEKGQQSVKDMQSILDAVTNDPKIYGGRAAVANKLVPNVLGAPAALSGLSKEQLSVRTNAAAMTADITHSLYGSAFSAGEQAQAKGFLVKEDDPTSEVQRKLAGRMKLEQDHIAGKPSAAQGAAAARSGGAPNASGATSDDALVNKYLKKPGG